MFLFNTERGHSSIMVFVGFVSLSRFYVRQMSWPRLIWPEPSRRLAVPEAEVVGKLAASAAVAVAVQKVPAGLGRPPPRHGSSDSEKVLFHHVQEAQFIRDSAVQALAVAVVEVVQELARVAAGALPLQVVPTDFHFLGRLLRRGLVREAAVFAPCALSFLEIAAQDSLLRRRGSREIKCRARRGGKRRRRRGPEQRQTVCCSAPLGVPCECLAHQRVGEKGGVEGRALEALQ